MLKTECLWRDFSLESHCESLVELQEFNLTPLLGILMTESCEKFHRSGLPTLSPQQSQSQLTGSYLSTGSKKGFCSGFGCDCLYWPVSFSDSGGSSLLCDLTSLMDLRSFDFQFTQLFSCSDGVINLKPLTFCTENWNWSLILQHPLCSSPFPWNVAFHPIKTEYISRSLDLRLVIRLTFSLSCVKETQPKHC